MTRLALESGVVGVDFKLAGAPTTEELTTIRAAWRGRRSLEVELAQARLSPGEARGCLEALAQARPGLQAGAAGVGYDVDELIGKLAMLARLDVGDVYGATAPG